jgi:di/tricarboxylate transporter
MTLLLVLALLAAAVVMFALNRPRIDVVAVIVMVALPLTGAVTVPEALAGFADPNVILIAALFVIGEALVRTGVAQAMGDWMTARAGASEARLIVFLMIAAAGLGSVMSSTGVVAIFIPIVLRIARRAALPAGRLLMPLSMAALISGMMTLVATAPNLVVHGELVRRGLDGFGFFAFTPFGIPILVLAILYMLVARRFLARGETAPPSERPGLRDWIAAYALEGREVRLRLGRASPLAGRQLAALDLRGSAGVNVIAIERPRPVGRRLLRPRADTVLEGGDVLLLDVADPALDLESFCRDNRLARLPLAEGWLTDHAQEIGMAEVLIPPSSRLVGRTLIEARFRTTHDLAAIGLKTRDGPAAGPVAGVPLRAGDTLLVTGPWRAIRRLAQDRRDLILLDLPEEAEDAVAAPGRAPHALAILGLVVAAMVTGIVPNVQAALAGCLALGLFRCIDMNAAYRAIHWQSLVLIVGMLPFSLALQRTGGVDIAADALIGALGEAGPRVVLAAIFLVTAVLSLFISNTATAVLMAPIALAIAEGLGASPYPFAMTVALAASAAFVTPVSSPVNTLVVAPGNYRFGDFVRIGGPFAVISLLAVVLLVPVLLPF